MAKKSHFAENMGVELKNWQLHWLARKKYTYVKNTKKNRENRVIKSPKYKKK